MSGLYVHFPFCIQKCNYCDFISFPVNDFSGRTQGYLSALLTEMEMREEEIASLGKEITVFFGGGTPTCMPVKEFEWFIKKFNRKLADISSSANIIEFTCEANPGTVDFNYLKMLRDNNVDRLSMGFQSMIDEELRILGRIHDSSMCQSGFDFSRKAGFSNINVDIMFGVPNQTLLSIGQTLKEVLRLGPEHISAYSLILEENTPLFNLVNLEMLTLPEEDEIMLMHELLLSELSLKGYKRYEISNFSLPGKECKHNFMYWKNGTYVGLGCAAHSHSPKGVRKANFNTLESYLHAVKTGDLPEESREILTKYRMVSDTIILGLRTSEGANIEKISLEYGLNVEKHYEKSIKLLLDRGLIEMVDGSVFLTDEGFLLGNLVFTEFLE